MKKDNCAIIYLPNGKELAKLLAAYCPCDLLESSIENYSLHEKGVWLHQHIEYPDLIITQGTSGDVNHDIMELLLLLNQLPNSNNKHLILPLIPYAREVKHLLMLTEILHNLGVKNIITLDIHDKAIMQLSKIPIHNIELFELFTSSLQEFDIVVAPDKGAEDRARLLSNKLNLPYLVMHKERDERNIIHHPINTDLTNQRILVIDDIIDSSKTISSAIEVLQRQPIKDIEVFTTHTLMPRSTIGPYKLSFAHSPLSSQKFYFSGEIIYKIIAPLLTKA